MNIRSKLASTQPSQQLTLFRQSKKITQDSVISKFRTIAATVSMLGAIFQDFWTLFLFLVLFRGYFKLILTTRLDFHVFLSTFFNQQHAKIAFVHYRSFVEKVSKFFSIPRFPIVLYLNFGPLIFKKESRIFQKYFQF